MANNVEANAGSGGATFASDEISSVHYPVGKLAFGADGTATWVSTSDGLPVQPATSSSWTVANAGTFAVQVSSIAAGDNNIGNVDIASHVPGTGATNLGKAIDSAAGSTDTGVAILAVRDDALSSLTPAEGDYAPLRVDANGAAWVIVSGTVTVGSHAVTNAGTFAVQESGAALTALQVIDDWDESDRAKVNLIAGQAGITAAAGAVAANTPRITLASDDPAVALLTTIDGDTGGILTAVQLIDDAVFAEDAAHQSGDKGFQVLSVRKDSAGPLSGADNDYQPLITDANGRLHANVGAAIGVGATASTVPTSGYLVAGDNGSGTLRAFHVDDTGYASVNIQNSPAITNVAPGTGASNLGKAEDGAHTSGDVGVFVLAVRRDTAAVGSGTDGDYSSLNVDGSGRLWSLAVQSGTWTMQPGNTANTTPWLVTDTPATSGGLLMHSVVSAASTNAATVKASAGQVFNISGFNLHTAPLYLKLYNKASAPAPASDTPVQRYLIPSNGTSGAGFTLDIGKGLAFGTGIAYILTTGIGDTDNTATSANIATINIGYK